MISTPAAPDVQGEVYGHLRTCLVGLLPQVLPACFSHPAEGGACGHLVGWSQQGQEPPEPWPLNKGEGLAIQSNHLPNDLGDLARICNWSLLPPMFQGALPLLWGDGGCGASGGCSCGKGVVPVEMIQHP